MNYEEMEKDLRALFGTPEGRRCLQHILDYAGNNQASAALTTEELQRNHGARGLALDLATMAGALPEVPGAGGRPEPPERPGEALGGAPQRGDDEGDLGEEATA